MHTQNDNRVILLFFCLLMVFSVIYSVFLQSVCMFAFIGLAFLEIRFRPFSIGFARDIPAKLRSFFRSPNYWPFLLLFAVPLLTGLYSENIHDWSTNLRVRLPFLGLPVAFFLLPRLEDRQVMLILKTALAIAVISAFAISVRFFFHMEEYVALINVGKSIPTPANHVRYSLWIAFLTICGGIVLAKGKYGSGIEKGLLTGTVIFLFLFMHLLSVRIGLVVLYISSLFFLGLYIIRTRRFLAGIIGLGLLIAVPLLSVELIPSLEKKVAYSKWDWQMYRSDKGSDYSDSERILSLKLGWEIFRRHPVLGIGTGDMTDTMGRRFREEYGIEKDILPHNQLLYLLTATGLAGTVISFIGLILPFLYGGKWKDPFLGALLLLFVLASLVENPLETSAGVTILLFPYFILLSRTS